MKEIEMGALARKPLNRSLDDDNDDGRSLD